VIAYLRVTRCYQSRSTLAAARQTPGSLRPPGTHLRVVYRGLWHYGSAGGQGAAGGLGVRAGWLQCRCSRWGRAGTWEITFSGVAGSLCCGFAGIFSRR